MPLLVIEHAEEKPIDNLSSFVVAAPAAPSLMCEEDVRDHLPVKYDAPLVRALSATISVAIRRALRVHQCSVGVLPATRSRNQLKTTTMWSGVVSELSGFTAMNLPSAAGS